MGSASWSVAAPNGRSVMATDMSWSALHLSTYISSYICMDLSMPIHIYLCLPIYIYLPFSVKSLLTLPLIYLRFHLSLFVSVTLIAHERKGGASNVLKVSLERLNKPLTKCKHGELTNKK